MIAQARLAMQLGERYNLIGTISKKRPKTLSFGATFFEATVPDAADIYIKREDYRHAVKRASDF
jgi:hypothetical protein